MQPVSFVWIALEIRHMHFFPVAATVLGLVAASSLLSASSALEKGEKEKRELAPAQADSQQGFSYEYCRDMLEKAKTGGKTSAEGPRDPKVRDCMSTGKID